MAIKVESFKFIFDYSEKEFLNILIILFGFPGKEHFSGKVINNPILTLGEGIFL